MDIFFEVHKDIPREGPGDRQSTRHAYQFVSVPSNAQILDIGCGPGDQTLELALLSKSDIYAVDAHEPFLRALEERAIGEGLQSHIHPMKGNMFQLDFSEEQFDLIWSEGAIYIMGFETGLKSWQRHVKPGGYVVVSEASWLTEHPSPDPQRFWETGYPGMKTVSENLAIVDSAGYEIVHHFVLAEQSWWTDYYTPMEQRIQFLQPQYESDPDAAEVLRQCQLEIDLYRKYAAEYGYVFYIMRRREG